MDEQCDIYLCEKPATIKGSSTIHGFVYYVCDDHEDSGYENAMAEHEPCNC